MDAATTDTTPCDHGDQVPRFYAPPQAHAATRSGPAQAKVQEVRLRVPPFYILHVPQAPLAHDKRN